MYWKLIWEAAKEPLRLLVLAIIPTLIAMVAELPYQWVVFVVFGLRFLDKLLHEFGKETGDATLTKGITQF